MKKELNSTSTVQFVVNSFYIDGYSFRQHDPDNFNTARIDIMYSLANTDTDGKMTLSPMPSHREITMSLYNIGENRKLTDFMKNSGADKADLYDFSYRDIQRLVEEDIKKRFNFEE